jgi:hypothetical protein
MKGPATISQLEAEFLCGGGRDPAGNREVPESDNFRLARDSLPTYAPRG